MLLKQYLTACRVNTIFLVYKMMYSSDVQQYTISLYDQLTKYQNDYINVKIIYIILPYVRVLKVYQN